MGSFCCCEVTHLCLTLCDPMDCSMPGIPVLHSLTEFAKTHAIELMMPSKHLIFCHPFLLTPSISPSIRVFSNKLTFPIRWPKYWNFSINPSNEYSGLISFRIYWIDFFAVQGTLKSLLQQYNFKASVIWHSSFFMVKLSHLYMTSGKIMMNF